MLKEIKIERFKNIREVTLPLSRVNVIVGANNSGKSSILQGVQFAVSIAQSAKLAGGTKTLSPEQLVYAPLREATALGYGGDLRQSTTSAIVVTFVEDDGSTRKVQVIRGKNANLSIQVTEPAPHALSTLAPPFSLYVPGLAGLQQTETFVTAAVMRRTAMRGNANAVLRNVLHALSKQEDQWRLFTEQLGEMFPEHQVSIAFDQERDEFIQAKVSRLGVVLPIDAAGTGFLQTVQILAYLAYYSPRLLLLDEPDSHIHPDRQRRLMTLLASHAAEHGTQVLIATHSRHMIDELGGNAAFHWISNGDRVEGEKFDHVKVLVDLGALDRWDRLRHGEVRGVVLTEDANAVDGKGKPAPIRTLLESSGVDLTKVQVWSYEGCTNLHTAKVLAKFIHQHAPAARILVHLDRDYAPDDLVNDKIESFAKEGIPLFVTSGTDAESHLLDIDHLCAIFSTLTREAIEKAVANATEAAVEESIRRFSGAEEGRRRHTPNALKPYDNIKYCKEQFELNPRRFRYGKKALNVTAAAIQQMMGKNINIYQPSQHVAVPEMVAFAASMRSDNEE